MGTVEVYTKPRMQQIENETITEGEVDEFGDLILTTREGTPINAGHVRGEDATALLNIEDTPSVDVTKTGSGTPADPWVIKADVKPDYMTAQLESAMSLTGIVKSKTDTTVTVTTSGGDITVPLPQESLFKGDAVVLTKVVGNTYVITSIAEVCVYPTLQNNWTSYSDHNGTDEYAQGLLRNQVAVTKRNGFVHVHALIQGGTLTPNTLLFTLPDGYRPDTDGMFYVECGGVMKAVLVKANGRVETAASWTAGLPFVSLDDIIFPVAGRATWIPFGTGGSSWGSGGWVDHAGGFGTASYWVDEYGIIWFRGMVKNGALTDPSPIVLLPTALGASTNNAQAISCVSWDAFAWLGYGISTDPRALVWRGGVNSGWVSLAGVTARSASSDTLMPWRTPRVVTAGWGSYGSGYAPLKTAVRPDGMFFLQGMISGGTPSASNAVIFLDFEGRSTQTCIRLTSSGGGKSRIDLIGMNNNTAVKGSLVVNSGISAWVALESIKGFAVKYRRG